jgi:hypothetical protein
MMEGIECTVRCDGQLERLTWSNSPAAYAAFAWCRAVGRKPSEKTQ